MLCTSEPGTPRGSGYCIYFDVYIGAHGAKEEDLSSRVVRELLEPPSEHAVECLGKGYQVQMDNFFHPVLLV